MFDHYDRKMARSVNGGGQAVVLLTGLSKAFDCIDHELLIEKLMLTVLIKIPCNLLIRIWKDGDEEPR